MAINDFRKFYNESTIARGYKPNTAQTELFGNIILYKSDDVKQFFADLLKDVYNCKITAGAKSAKQEDKDIEYKTSLYILELSTEKAGNRVSLNRIQPVLKQNNIKYDRLDINKLFIKTQSFTAANGKTYDLKYNVIIRGHGTKNSLTNMVYNDISIAVNKTDIQETVQLCSIISNLEINTNNLLFSHPHKQLGLDYWFEYIKEADFNMTRFNKTGLAAVKLFAKYGIKPNSIIECGLFKDSKLENTIKIPFNANIKKMKINKFNLNSFFPADIYFLTEPVSTFENDIINTDSIDELTDVINKLIGRNIIIPISLKLNGDLRRTNSNYTLHNSGITNLELTAEATLGYNIEKTIDKVKTSKDNHVSIPLYFHVRENNEEDEKIKLVQLTMRTFGSDNSMSFDCSYYYVNQKTGRSSLDSSNLDCRGKGKELFDYLMRNKLSANDESNSDLCNRIINCCAENKHWNLTDPINKKILRYFRKFFKLIEDNPNNILIAYSACKKINSQHVSFFPKCYAIS